MDKNYRDRVGSLALSDGLIKKIKIKNLNFL